MVLLLRHICRRAKAKVQEGKSSGHGESTESPREKQASELSPVTEVNIRDLIHEYEREFPDPFDSIFALIRTTV